MYRPYHLIGLELGVSVLSAALRGEPTGSTAAFRGDAVAVAKRDLKAGEKLDGEGGYTVWGKLWPAARSLAHGALPIGLAHGVVLERDIAEGEAVCWADVAIGDNQAVSLRREAEGDGRRLTTKGAAGRGRTRPRLPFRLSGRLLVQRAFGKHRKLLVGRIFLVERAVEDRRRRPSCRACSAHATNVP